MTLVIDLTPAEEARLARAAGQEGLEPQEVIRRPLADPLPPVAGDGEDPTLALLSRWEEEDAHMSPEEIAAENRSWEEFKASINAERDRAGARRVF